MQCTNCGKELTAEDTFCNNCGLAVKDVSQPTNVAVNNNVENGGAAPAAASIPLESQPDPNKDTIPYNQVVQAAPAAEPVAQAPVAQEPAQPVAQVAAPAVQQVAPAQEVAQPVVAEAQPVAQPTTTLQAPAAEPVVQAAAQPQQVDVQEVMQAQVAQAQAAQQTQPVVEQPVAQVQTAATTTTEVPKTNLTPPPVTETTNLGGNPAVAQVMGSDFAAEHEAASKIPSGGVDYGPAPIVDPPQVVVQTISGPGYQPNMGAKKGISGALLVVIIVVAAVAFLGVGLFVGSIMFSNNVSKSEGSELGGDDNKKESSAIVTVTFGGAKFNIPDDYYDYDLEDDKLAVYNDDIYFYIMVAPKSYTQYNSNIPYLKKYYEGLGYMVSSAEEKKVGDQRYIIMDMSNNSGKVSLFIRSFTNNSSLTGAIAKTTDSYATAKDLSDVESILSTSQIVTKSVKATKEVYYNEVLKGIIEAKLDETPNEKPLEE